MGRFCPHGPAAGAGRGVFLRLRRLRRLLPGAGGHRAVGLRPLAHRGPPPPAASDRGPGLLPGVHRAGEPSAGAAAGPREGGAEQLPLPHRRPLRHPRRRAAGLRPLPAGAGDQPGRGGALLFAAHRLRGNGLCGAGGGLSGPLRCARPGKDRRPLGTDLHGAGGRGGAAGRCPRAAAAPPDAGEALAGPLFPVRLRAGLPAAAGSKPRLAGGSTAKTDGVSAEKKCPSKKVMDRCTLIDN